MRLHVDTQPASGGMTMPQGFYLRARYVAVVETIDQWFGPDYRYVKVRGDDGGCYILRVHDAHDDWQLTMFQSQKAQGLAVGRR
jgi:hypothetical protein